MAFTKLGVAFISLRKVAQLDPGILNLFSIDQPTKLLENIVFLHLYRSYKDRLFYFKRKLEVDFYVPEEKLLIQVSFSVADIETKKRETNALLVLRLRPGTSYSDHT